MVEATNSDEQTKGKGGNKLHGYFRGTDEKKHLRNKNKSRKGPTVTFQELDSSGICTGLPSP